MYIRVTVGFEEFLRNKMKNSIVFIAVLVVLLLCCGLLARQTTEYEAEKVVSGWLKASPRPLGTTLGRRIKNIEAFSDDANKPAYYIVNMEPSGFVIVSADNRIEPIIGFAADGTYDFSFENPLVALVTGDLSERVEAVRNAYYLQTTIEAQSPEIPHGKWQYFIGLAASTDAGRFAVA